MGKETYNLGGVLPQDCDKSQKHLSPTTQRHRSPQRLGSNRSGNGILDFFSSGFGDARNEPLRCLDTMYRQISYQERAKCNPVKEEKSHLPGQTLSSKCVIWKAQKNCR